MLGIKATTAAGMRAFGYAGAGNARALRSAGARVFEEMQMLPGLLAAVFAARRPQAIEDDDTEVFTKALHHWAVAAYEVGQSPREMKRFLNRLRFAAAGRAVDLRDDILVGLGVLEHAGALPELMDTVPNGATALHAAIDARGNSSPAFARISEALYPDALARSGLPCFEPTPAQVQTFLALWEGVKVEA